VRLELKSYLANEIDILLSWITTEKELRQWAGPTIFSWPINKKQLFNYLARTQGTYPEAIIFKVIENSNLIVGHIEFDKIDWINKTTILSRVIIAPEFRHHGLGHEIVNIALNSAFNVFRFNEIKLSVYNFNTAALRCYKAAGFKTIDIIKDLSVNEFENWSTQIMSLSSIEYRKKRI